MAMDRVQVVWSGAGIVGPGLSTFYFNAPDAGEVAALVTFFDAIKGALPSFVTVTVPSVGDTIDEKDGSLTATWSASGEGGSVTGTATGDTFALGVGARVVWETGAISGRRRLRGSTFLVPLAVNVYEGTGALKSSFLSTAGSAITGLLTNAPHMVIWARPFTDPDAIKPHRDGFFALVQDGNVPDRISWLRSRRT